MFDVVMDMRYFVMIGMLFGGLAGGCAVEGSGQAGDETDVAITQAVASSDDLSLGDGISPGPILAASCGRVTLDFCHDPRFPAQVTATCHPAQRCSCASEIATCQSLVRQFCGSNVQNIVASNCDRP